MRVLRLMVLGLVVVGMASIGAAQTTNQIPGTDDSQDSISTGFDYGQRISMNKDRVLNSFNVYDALENGYTAGVYNLNDSTSVAQTTTGTDKAVFSSKIVLEENHHYDLYVETDTASVDLGSNSYPYTYTELDFIGYGSNCDSINGCTFNGGSSNIYSIYAITTSSPNEAPQFNSTSVSPDPPLIGENVSYGAEVFDPDGSIDYTNLTLEYGGSEVVTDAQRTGTNPSWNDIYQPSDGNKWLNATLTTVDDAGATTSTEINRYLSDEAPNVEILKPGNQTYWSYDVPLNVTADDSDSVPGEDYSCEVFSDNQQLTFSRNPPFIGTEGGYYNNTFRRDLGGHNVTVECSDPAGNTGSDTEYFSVNDFEINSGQIYSNSPVYETENVSFESSVYQGDMVDAVDFNLVWNGSEVNSASQSLDDEGTLTQDLIHTIPLVSSNKTSVDWKWNFTVNRTTFQGSSVQEHYSSSVQGQSVFWSYWIAGSTGLFDQNPSTSQVEVLEGQDAGHRVNVSRKTGSASLSGEMNFTRSSEVVDLNRKFENSSLVVFQASELSDRVSSSSRTDDVNSSITVEFQDDSRVLEASDAVETFQVQFGQGISGSDGLQFQVLQENNFSNTLESDIDLAVEYWAENSSERVTRTFSTASEGKQTHTFQVSPSWAELVVDSSEKLIQYQDSDENYRLRSYFLLEEEISSNLTEVDLYAIQKSVSSRIGIETVDSDGSTISEVIIRAERYFPAQDKALSVVMARTGSDGRTESFFEVNEIYYGFKFYRKDDSGTYRLVSEEPQQIISQDLLRFTVEDIEQIGYYDFLQGIGSSCDYNATRVTCSYSSEEAVEKVTLSVEEERPVAWETVCEKVASTASATLTCDGLNASDKDFSYTLSATSGDGDRITLDTGKSGEAGSGFGDTGLVISFFFFLTLGLGSMAGPRPIPEVSVLLSTVAVVVSYTSGLLAITYQAAATFVILGAITIYKMRRDVGGGIGL